MTFYQVGSVRLHTAVSTKSTVRVQAQVVMRRERVDTSDGDFVDIDYFDTAVCVTIKDGQVSFGPN
jgi:predicted alpha/beta-fold hydrolase